MKVKGLWLRGGTYWFRLMQNGHRHVWNLHTSDIATAISRAAEKKTGIGSLPADEVKRELGKAIAYKLSHKAIRDKTETGMQSVAKIFYEWCGPISVEAVTAEKAASFVKYLRDKDAGRGMAEAGVQSYVRSLRSMFSWLRENNRVMINPFAGIKLPKLAKSPRRDFCSETQRDKLIAETTDEDLRLVMLLGFHAGLRKLEIVEARSEWIDLDQKVIHVCQSETYTPKDSEDRTIPLAKPLLQHFKKHGVNSPFLIHPEVERGKSEYRYDYRLPLTKHVTAQGLPWVTSHLLRRTFASLLIQRGVSIYKVAKWLGDAVAVVENSYGHLKAYDDDIN